MGNFGTQLPNNVDANKIAVGMVNFVKNLYNAQTEEFIVKVIACVFALRVNFGMELSVCKSPIVVVDKNGIVNYFIASAHLTSILMDKNV